MIYDLISLVLDRDSRFLGRSRTSLVCPKKVYLLQGTDWHWYVLYGISPFFPKAAIKPIAGTVCYIEFLTI